VLSRALPYAVAAVSGALAMLAIVLVFGIGEGDAGQLVKLQQQESYVEVPADQAPLPAAAGEVVMHQASNAGAPYFYLSASQAEAVSAGAEPLNAALRVVVSDNGIDLEEASSALVEPRELSSARGAAVVAGDGLRAVLQSKDGEILLLDASSPQRLQEALGE
jgi:hypothetical protein